MSGCKCSLVTKLLGDGCEHCNPELAAWYECEVVDDCEPQKEGAEVLGSDDE